LAPSSGVAFSASRHFQLWRQGLSDPATGQGPNRSATSLQGPSRAVAGAALLLQLAASRPGARRGPGCRSAPACEERNPLGCEKTGLGGWTARFRLRRQAQPGHRYRVPLIGAFSSSAPAFLDWFEIRGQRRRRGFAGDSSTSASGLSRTRCYYSARNAPQFHAELQRHRQVQRAGDLLEANELPPAAINQL